MQAKFSDQLHQSISHERLDAYRQRGSSSDYTELFAYYAWNMALSESLYTPLQCLEVSHIMLNVSKSTGESLNL
jgi:hypothetical protein